MSQLEGDIEFNLGSGLSWNAVIKITATSQRRRKVILEMAKANTAGPGLLLLLTPTDDLVLRLRDKKGETFETKPVPKGDFADRVIWLRAEVIPMSQPKDGSRLGFRVAINDRVLSEAEAEGDFDEHVTGRQSVGSSLTGDDPATFSVAEIAMYAQALSERDREHMSAYFKERYGLRMVQE